jgi:diaminohydroxyphosphoribosylaminopyrimidine deaminase/5-amino-6-(5-phosphoribosylamino)uracil reductase
MNAKTLMRRAIALAKRGEGNTSFHPLESMLWFQGDTLFAWYYESGKELQDALKTTPSIRGGTVALVLGVTAAPIEWLRAHGVEVVLIPGSSKEPAYAGLDSLNVLIQDHLLTESAASLQAVWDTLRTKHRPYVTLSFGMSLDGKIATYTGDSKYISGTKSRIAVHRQRNRHQAILVGIQTVLADHPLLNTRLLKHARNPIRVVLDSKLRIPETEPMLQHEMAGGTILFTLPSADPVKVARLRSLGATVLITSGTDKINLSEALRQLYDRGIDSVLVEGGGTIHFAFLSEGLVDSVHAYVSPLLIGGETAKNAVAGQGFDTLAKSFHLSFQRIRRLGDDLLLEAVPKSKP